MLQEIENLDVPQEERDYLRFVLLNSEAFQQEWSEIQGGDHDLPGIINPIYETLGQEAADAKAAILAYEESFLSFVRSSNSGIRARLDDLLEAAKTADAAIPPNIFAGGFKTHSFNAEACQSGKTHLILVHSGLEQMLVESTRLLFAIHQKSAPMKAERLPDPIWLEGAPLDALIFDFAQILASFIARETPSPMFLDDDRYPFEADKEFWAFSTAASAQDFVLAHELGHVALGHLSDSERCHSRKLRSGVRVFGKNQLQEFAADSFAAKLLFSDQHLPEEQKVLDMIYGKYMGIGIFFDLDDLISEIEHRAFGLDQFVEDQSHPPARFREARLLAEIRHRSRNQFLFADRRALGRTVKRHREALIDETVSLILDYDWG